jgi:phasin family protein
MQPLSDNPALRAHLESQVEFTNQLLHKTIETVRQLSEINLKLSRQILEGSVHASREILACTDPMQMSQVAMKQLQPHAERLRAWQQHVVAVLAGVQADLTHAAEATFPEASRSASAVADEMVRRANAAINVPAAGASASSDTKH